MLRLYTTKLKKMRGLYFNILTDIYYRKMTINRIRVRLLDP